MDATILWCGFAGAWLLVAGPLYQAALELKDEDIEMDRLRAASAEVEKSPEISPWWWLLPPIKIYLERRREHQYRERYIAALSPEDVEAFISFMSKAVGWLFVAGGGLLLATKETYELCEHYDWNHFVFAGMLIGMALLSVLNTIGRIIRSQAVITKHK